MRRTATLAALAVFAVLVVLAAVLLTGGDDGPTPAAPAGEDLSACLGEVILDDPSCAPLRERLATQAGQDDGVVDVLVLLDATTETGDADRAVGLITDATRMWQGGLDGLTEDGRVPELLVTTERVGPGTTFAALDAEVVFVVAADSDTAGGTTLAVYDAEGTRCAAYDDVFALGAWTARPDFDSHHRLPEGTLDQDCGGAGADVCLAVNATFVAGGVDPMEAFGLVGDELGHCLGSTRS